MGLGTRNQEQVKIAALRKCRIFATVPDEETKRMAGQAELVLYRKNETIFREEEPSDFLYIVQDGLVKVYKSTDSGKFVTFTVAGPGDTLNAAALTSECYFMSAQALNSVTVLRVHRQIYLVLLSTYSAIAMELNAILARRLNREASRVVGILSERVEQRLVVSLSALFRKFGAHLPITSQELANCAGTTAETAIRVLSTLKKRGIVGRSRGQRGIIVTSPAELEELAVGNKGWM